MDCTHSARIALISLEYTTFEINTKSTHIIKHIFKVIIANPFCVKISVGQKQFEKQLLPTRKPNGETLRCVCVCIWPCHCFRQFNLNLLQTIVAKYHGKSHQDADAKKRVQRMCRERIAPYFTATYMQHNIPFVEEKKDF